MFFNSWGFGSVEAARNFSKRFIVGTGAIINSKPILFPMVLNNKGRWIGKIV